MAIIFARFLTQNEFIYKTVFSARFDKQDEDDQALAEIELYIYFNIDRKLTESDID